MFAHVIIWVIKFEIWCYVNLLDLAKALSLNNSTQYISYAVPHTMSIRKVCFNNNLDFDNVATIKAITAANPGKFSSVNKIHTDSGLLLPNGWLLAYLQD